MSAFLERISLRGQHVALEPLTLEHHDALVAAASDGELWRSWVTIVATPETMRADIEARLARYAKGVTVPFVMRRLADNKVVGATTYHDIDAANRRLEIGYTWIAVSAQRTAINTEAKLLMLSDCFERLQCNAVEFRTHWHNRQSRAAIERLGAKLDGVLRNHRIMPNGTLRDTCVYSIVAAEWPAVRAGLQERLARGSA